MKPNDVVTIARSGAIYVPKLTTKHLGVFGWAWVAVAIEEKYITMRFYKESIAPKMDEFTVKLRKKSGGRQAMTGGCIKFAEAIKDDFGDANYLDLHIKAMLADEESVRISLDRPSRKDEESTQGFAADEDARCEEKAEANEDEAGKKAQVEVARWIRDYGCDEVSCNGTEGEGRFDGVACPLRGRSEGCGRYKLKEGVTAENWLTSNGYSLDKETPLGTISKPAEQQLDIFNLTGSKAGRAPQTRPLPEGLPEWLRTPMSKGLHVEVAAIGREKYGWAIGAFKNTVSGNTLIAVYFDNVLPCAMCFTTELSPASSRLKPAIECYKVAGKLGIGLSALQIEAINSGGVPPESHGLPGEMFE